MNIIKDTEDKKNKEIAFYEGKMLEITQENKKVLARHQEMDQVLYKLKEELKKQSLEN